MGARLRAGKAARDRAADGLDRFGRYAPAGSAPVSTPREEAIAYCERHGIAYQVFEPKPEARRGISYADNFAFKRRDPWTH